VNPCPFGTFYNTQRPYEPALYQPQMYYGSSYTCPIYESYSQKYYNDRVKLTEAEVELRNSLRMLWEQHAVWTRAAIMSIVMNLPDVDLVVKRLLRNPVDFENALRPYYGSQIAAKFSELLKGHLTIAAELVKAAKAGDSKRAAEAEKNWYANADEIAELLENINPNWSREVWKAMLHEHLALVKAEAVNMLTKKYGAAIDVYDKIESQSLKMADELSEGIIKQFPNKFT
jgi:hypothetical protein